MSAAAVARQSSAPPAAEEPSAPKALKPETLDTLAAEYLGIQADLLQDELALANKSKPKLERLDALRGQFLEQCEAHGSPHEKKSKLLSGLEYEVMTTASTSSSLDQAAIADFQLFCGKAEKSSLFDELFEKVSEYRLRPGAGEVVRRSMGKAGKLTGKLALDYLKCEVRKSNPPRLAAVRPRKKTPLPA